MMNMLLGKQNDEHAAMQNLKAVAVCVSSKQILPFSFAWLYTSVHSASFSKHETSIVGTMLVHRLRRWPNIDPTMDEWLVFVSSTGK